MFRAWEVQPEPRVATTSQCAGIKAFVVNLVIQRSSNEELFRSDKVFMNKINMVLVQIVKQARHPRRKGHRRRIALRASTRKHCRRYAQSAFAFAAPGVAACLAVFHL